LANKSNTSIVAEIGKGILICTERKEIDMNVERNIDLGVIRSMEKECSRFNTLTLDNERWVEPNVSETRGKDIRSWDFSEEILTTHIRGGIDFNNNGNIRCGKSKIIKGSDLGRACNLEKSSGKIPMFYNRISNISSAKCYLFKDNFTGLDGIEIVNVHVGGLSPKLTELGNSRESELGSGIGKGKCGSFLDLFVRRLAKICS
jgi:hypothetical protein